MLTIEVTEIAVAPFNRSLPAPTLSTLPAPQRSPKKPAKPVWPTFTPTRAPLPSSVDADLVRRVIQERDDEDRDDSAPLGIDLKTDLDDSADTFVAKRLLSLLMDDISGKVTAEPDLFGDIQHDREQRKLDALVWLYDLNPDGARVSFDWVCNELGTDGEVLRRVIARNMRQELKRVLKMLACMVGDEHARNCECELSDYVNLSGWKDN